MSKTCRILERLDRKRDSTSIDIQNVAGLRDNTPFLVQFLLYRILPHDRFSHFQNMQFQDRRVCRQEYNLHRAELHHLKEFFSNNPFLRIEIYLIIEFGL